MNNTAWKKITAIAAVIGMLIPSISINSFADEIIVSEEAEYSAEAGISEAGSLYSEDEFIVEESDDWTLSVDNGITPIDEQFIDDAEAVVEEDLNAQDTEFIPQTETQDLSDAQATVVREETEPVLIANTSVEPLPSEFPTLAVKDSADGTMFLDGISLTISKFSATTIIDSTGTEIQRSETTSEVVGSFDSETDYVKIDLASILSALEPEEITAPSMDEARNTSETFLNLVIEETSLYPGYRFDGAYKTIIEVHRDAEGNLILDYGKSRDEDRVAEQQDDGSWNLTFMQKTIEAFSVASYEDGSREIVRGSAFKLCGTAGSELVPGTDFIVTDATVSGTSVTITNKPAEVTLTNEEEISVLSSDPSKHLQVQWITIPEGYTTSSSTSLLDFTSRVSELYLQKIVLGSIGVDVQRVLYDEKTANPTDMAETYTFALYKEDGKTLISTRQVTISPYHYKSITSAAFDNLDEGVYYLKEIGTTGSVPDKINFVHSIFTANGQVNQVSGTQSDNGVKITIKLNDSDGDNETTSATHGVSFTNVYSHTDPYKGSFRIKVRVVDENNQETPVTVTAGFTVKWTAGGKNWAVNPKPSLSLENGTTVSSKMYTIPFPASDQMIGVKVKMVSLTDENSNNVVDKYMLVDDTAYTKLSSYQKTINVTDGMTDGIVTFTLKQPPLLTVVKALTIKKPTAGKNKITAKWSHFKHTSKKTKAVWKKIKKIQVQCATDKGFRNIVKRVTISKSKTSVTIKGLKKKTVYYVRVRYYDGTGYSKWSKVKKVKTKK